MRELNVIECQEISGGIGLPTWCGTRCFFSSPTGIAVAILAVGVAVGAYFVLSESTFQY